MTKQEALIEIKTKCDFLRLHPEWNNDIDIILEAVKVDSKNILFASDDIRNNKHVCMLAIESFPFSLLYMPDIMKDDEELALKAVKKEGGVLTYLSNKIKDNKTVVLAAIKNNHIAMLDMSFRLKNDLEFFYQIVNSCKTVGYKYFGEDILKNKECCLYAIQKNIYNFLEFPLFQYNKKVAMEVVKKDGKILERIPVKLRTKELCSIAIQTSTDFNNMANSIPKEYLDRETCIFLMKKNKESIHNFPKNIKDDFEIQMMYYTSAVKNNIKIGSSEFFDKYCLCPPQKARLLISQHPDFIPSIEQYNKMMKTYSKELREVCALRKDEWVAKWEESELKNRI